MSARAVAVAAAVAAVTALGGAPAALADTSQSSNWAGYAVHRTGVHFTKVVGEWTEPQATCTAGEPTYSSVWVGIGGYSESSAALEQIGTETDCSAAGRASSSAWYELVPAVSQTIKLTVNPGDRVRATVSVAGREVSLMLDDLTRHRSFTRRLRATELDTTSAEWIVEAPSVCSGAGENTCQTLPLADFGSTAFTSAAASSTGGHTGKIDDPRWTTTKITLAQDGRQFIGAGGPPGQTASVIGAAPSALTAGGSAFTITYRGSTGGVTQSAFRRVTAGHLVHAAALSPSS